MVWQLHTWDLMLGTVLPAFCCLQGKGRLAAYWRKGYKEGEEDYEDEAARLQELEQHVSNHNNPG